MAGAAPAGGPRPVSVHAVTLSPGLTATVVLTVAEADLAPAHRSGEVPVLATPRLIALCEEATVASVAGRLGPGETTVGVRVELDHLAASSPGATVTATAILEEVAGRRLTFSVIAAEGDRLVGRGSITRTLVDRARFLAQAGS